VGLAEAKDAVEMLERGGVLPSKVSQAAAETQKAEEMKEQQRGFPPKVNHAVIGCEKCGQKLRVPVLEDEIAVTCPSCRHQFSHRSTR